MYWTEWERNKIRRANLDGSGSRRPHRQRARAGLAGAGRAGRQDLLDGLGHGQDSACQPRRNSNIENLVTIGLNSPGGLALDVANGKMYWTDSFWHKIQRGSLDGSNVEDLITTGLDGPSGLDLDLANGKDVLDEPECKQDSAG